MNTESPSNMTRCELLVIGGGPSARGILMVLAEELARGQLKAWPKSIVILERGTHFGVGLPWNPLVALDEHLSSLAEPHSRMSYGQRQIQQVDQLVKYLAGFGVRVQLCPQHEAVSVEKDEENYSVTTQCRRRFLAPFIVVATGHWRAKDPLESTPGYHPFPWPARELQEAVIPLPADISQRNPKRILILGTYLSGIDAAISLALRAGRFLADPSGRVSYLGASGFHLTLASRHGLLPKVWGRDPANHAPKVLNEQRLKELLGAAGNNGFLSLQEFFKLWMEELCGAVPGAVPPRHANNGLSAKGFVRAVKRRAARQSQCLTLRKDIATVLPEGKYHGQYADVKLIPWQCALFAMLPFLSEHAHRWPAEDWEYFDTSVRSIFYNFTMPMPLDCACKLEALMNAGHLDVIALGESYRLEAGPPGFQLHVGAPAGGSSLTRFSDVVNAHRHETYVDHHPSPVISAMLRDGLIQPALRRFRESNAAHQLRQKRGAHHGARLVTANGDDYLVARGMYVNPNTCELIPRGVFDSQYQGPRQNGLYATGPNLTGQFIDAQSIGQIERDARRILRSLNGRLS
jgi:hypothetical protein